jgi:tyrosyl-tRNA synthetase
VRLNASGYFGQLMRVLDEDRVEIVNNADWLAPMRLGDILDYTRQMTIAQLLERDDFARRFAARQPITLSEFFYPLLQGIDSVEIHADIELGGTDQTFNNLVGRELQRARGQDPQAVLTVPLLVGTDGTEKMSKSLGNYIAIDDPADEQFGKLMSIPDTLVGMYARLCTAMHPREVDQIERQVAAGGTEANAAKRRVAREIVALYHGADEATAAEQRFDAVFKYGALPADVLEHALPAGDSVHLPCRPHRSRTRPELERGPSADRPRRGPRRRQAGSGRGVRPAGRRAGRLGGHGRQTSSDPPAPVGLTHIVTA